MDRIAAAHPGAASDRATRSQVRYLPLAIAASMAASLIVPGLGVATAQAKGTGPRPNADPASVAVQASHAKVRATAYDGGGPTFVSQTRQASDFELFDKPAVADDTDDAARGAKGTADLFASVAVQGPSISVHTLGTAAARMYDRDPADGNAPQATGQATLTVTIDVAVGTAFWSLRGTLEGDSDTANLDCGSAIVTAPDGIVTRANGGCELDDSVTVDQSGSLAPGTHTFDVTAGASVRTSSTTRNVRAGAAYDLVLVVSACSLSGTPDADADLVGTSGDDVICGLGGADDINGLGGDDIIFGGDGPDDVNGGSGVDLIFGGEGADKLRGGLHSDTIHGGPDRDEISDLGGPNHLLSGDAGDDVICGSNERDRIEGGLGSDSLVGFGGRDDIRGGGGPDGLEGDGNALIASVLDCNEPPGSATGSRADVIDGGPGNDQIAGGRGNDDLRGGNDDDTIDGGPDGDIISGGRGRDILRGDPGNDTMNACDGVRDRVFGGSGGNDIVKRDVGIDSVHADVETRRRC